MLVVVLALVITVPPCQSQEADMFAVVVDVDEDSMSVQMGGELDICKAFACPSGFKCEMVMSPALLKIPVPRCVPDKTAPVAPDNGKHVCVCMYYIIYSDLFCVCMWVGCSHFNTAIQFSSVTICTR